MKQRRLREGNRVLFDYRDLLGDGRKFKGKTLLKMKKGPMTYTTEENTRFFTEHPFQWVRDEEAAHLLSLNENGYIYFVEATIEDVEDYYYE